MTGRISLAAAIVALALATPTQARAHHRTRSNRTHATARRRPACPAGTPTQAITLVDQTGQRLNFTGLEHALTDQSLQLRAAWGTPCARFGSGGWRVYVQTGEQHFTDGSGTAAVGGYHYGTASPGPLWEGQPYAIVQTGDLPLTGGGARPISHELLEMLANPTDGATWERPSGIGGRLEVCDPVENLTYPLDGLQVSDFVTPAYFDGGAGPWDQAHALTGPLS